MDHTIINFGGSEYLAPIGRHKIIKPNTAYAFNIDTGVITVGAGEANITNSTISNNVIGLQSSSPDSVIIHNSEIFNNQAGIINYSATAIDATDNWWGHNSGPYHPTLNPDGLGNSVSGNVLFDPWVGKEEEKVPVIIVPGIMGSYLKRDELEMTEVWPNIIKMLLPGDDSYLNELAMQTNGYPDLTNPLLLPTDIIRKIYSSNFFQGLIDELESNGYQEGENLFVFPYDWRWFIDWTAGNDPFSTIQSLKEKVESILDSTSANKVNIIAHSMGGLVSKYYIQHFGTSTVDKFIDIATPHLGAPKAYKILMYGDDLGFNLLGILGANSNTIKNISQNIPSVYQLLPSQNYFNPADSDYAYYIYDMHDLDNNGITGRLDYSGSIEFMANTGRNEYLLDFNNSLHSQIDNYSPIEDNIQTFNIVGCGQPTIGQIFMMNKDKSGKYEYGLKYINGDETVPLASAENLMADDAYYVTDTKHAYLPSADGVKQLILAMLQGQADAFNYQDYNNLTKDASSCNFSGKQISFHSPIELHVYDEENNHLGPNQDGDIEIRIAGAQYDIIDDNKFVFLPEDQDYLIIGKATASGNCNMRIQNIMDSQYLQMIYYNEIPLDSASTTVVLELSEEQDDYSLAIDQQGDGIFEQQFAPSAILDQEEANDLTKPETNLIITGTSTDSNYYASVTIELIAQDNENGSGILKTEYSLDQGLSWQLYQNTFQLTELGQYIIQYYSTDRAGNIEKTKQISFSLITEEITIDGIIAEIAQFYEQGLINQEFVKNNLIKSLTMIKKQLEQYEENKAEREQRQTDRMEKCLQNRNQAWCDNTIGRMHQQINDLLEIIHNKSIIWQLQLILKQLKFYYQKNWLNSTAYDKIKTDIESLTNNF